MDSFVYRVFHSSISDHSTERERENSDRVSELSYTAEKLSFCGQFLDNFVDVFLDSFPGQFSWTVFMDSFVKQLLSHQH